MGNCLGPSSLAGPSARSRVLPLEGRLGFAPMIPIERASCKLPGLAHGLEVELDKHWNIDDEILGDYILNQIEYNVLLFKTVIITIICCVFS